MEQVRRLARELTRVVDESGIDERGVLHALALVASGGAKTEDVALLVASENDVALFYANGRRVARVAMPGAGAPGAQEDAN